MESHASNNRGGVLPGKGNLYCIEVNKKQENSLHLNKIECNSMDNDKTDAEHITKRRYYNFNLGLLQKIMFLCSQNIFFSIKTTIFLGIVFTLTDNVSNILVFIDLIRKDIVGLGIIVFCIDYLPGWVMLAHNIMFESWAVTKRRPQRLFMTVFSVFSPFSMALTHATWLIYFDTSDQELYAFVHCSAQKAEVMMGSFQSPAQMVVLLYMFAKKYYVLPWFDQSPNGDAYGNSFNFHKGVFSLLLSIVSIIKNFRFDMEGTNTLPEKYEILETY